MDVTDVGTQLKSFAAHRDPYNVGTLAGKGAKLLVQAYMSGLVDLIITIV